MCVYTYMYIYIRLFIYLCMMYLILPLFVLVRLNCVKNIPNQNFFSNEILLIIKW